MSQELFQLQNDDVTICKDNKTYQDTVNNFNADFANELTENVKEIIYNQTLNVYVVDGELQDVKTDSLLNQVIDSIDDLILKQAKRQPAPPEPEPPTAQDHEQIDPAILDLAEAVLELSSEIEKIKGGVKQ